MGREPDTVLFTRAFTPTLRTACLCHPADTSAAEAAMRMSSGRFPEGYTTSGARHAHSGGSASASPLRAPPSQR
jgi:hypothetical protein